LQKFAGQCANFFTINRTVPIGIGALDPRGYQRSNSSPATEDAQAPTKMSKAA